MYVCVCIIKIIHLKEKQKINMIMCTVMSAWCTHPHKSKLNYWAIYTKI